MRRYKCNNCKRRFFNRRRYRRHTCQDYNQYTINQLRGMAKEKGIEGIYSMNKQELIDKIKGA